MFNWFDIPSPFCDYGHARVIIIPAPYEGTVSWGKGTSLAPAAIREASPYIEHYNLILGSEPYRIGIHGVEPLILPADPWQAALTVKTAAMRELETARHPVMVGGEHSLTLGAVAAGLEGFPTLSVLQLDAHADLRDEYEGSKFSHACVMRRVAELGAPVTPVGVRAMSREERDWLDGQGREVISAREIRQDPGWTGRAIAALSDYVYVSLDVDVLDPGQMPATGCPEPGGLSYDQIVDLTLALAASGKQVIGLDLMELAPIPGLVHPTYLAASLLYTMIGAFFPPKE
jgi:agmatinase